MEYVVSRSGMLHYVNFTLINVKLADFIKYNVTLYSLLNQPMSLHVELQPIELPTASQLPLKEMTTLENTTFLLSEITVPGYNIAQSDQLALILLAIPISIVILAAASIIFLKAKTCKKKTVNPCDPVYDTLHFDNEEHA
ncbi:unnamed protein product [Lymnaea stagnalis]|uniref:Uncharacterized protein n=1 Tax=Lymnaea stagnalis TaxID=6523 RepID=A0AAV2HY52_LYMST